MNAPVSPFFTPYPYGPRPSSGVASTLFVDLFNAQTVAGVKRFSAASMIVDGLLGVGTASPVSKLDVVVGNGTGGRTDLHFRVQDGATAGTERNLKIGLNLSVGYAYLQSTLEGTDHTAIHINPAGGNVGIGTGATLPTSLLDVNGTGRFVGALTLGAQANLKSFTVATLPAATTAGGLIYVSDAAGGAVLAFSNGTNWLRCDTSAVVS